MLLAWLVCLVAGFGVVIQYEFQPGPLREVPGCWPAGGLSAPDPERATLLFFAHPRCPCTRASMGELSRLMTQARDLVTARVIFYAPAEAEAEWAETDLMRAARSIPGVSVAVDHGGLEAGRFGSSTSGHALLYAPDGHLLFSGGITGSRGHSGDNAGRTAIVELLRGKDVECRQTPVFGCGLSAEECAP